MPWSCSSCGATVQVDTDTECPQCQAPKQAWTVAENATREMVLARKRLRLLVGEGEEPLAAGDPALESVALAPAEHVVALPKEELFDLVEDGEHPAPADLLYVELTRGTKRDLSVTVEVVYGERPAEEVTLPREFAGEPSPVLTKLLFVFGPESLEGLALEGIQLVDLSEDDEDGCAEAVAISALGLPAQELPVEAAADFAFSV